MKTFAMFVLIAILFPVAAFGQQDSVVKARKYIGVLYTGSYDSKVVQNGSATLLLGGDAGFRISDHFTLNGLVGYEALPSARSLAFGWFYLVEKSAIVNFTAGYMPRPIANVMCPFPLSGDGHFSPVSLFAIPGQETGGYLWRKLWNNGPDVKAGAFYPASSEMVEWNASLQQNFGPVELAVAGYASRAVNGIAGRIKVKDAASLTAFAESDSLFTVFASWEIGSFVPYMDIIYNHEKNLMSHFEIALSRTFTMPYGMKMMFGTAYLQHNRSVNVYVQLYLQ